MGHWVAVTAPVTEGALPDLSINKKTLACLPDVEGQSSFHGEAGVGHWEKKQVGEV